MTGQNSNVNSSLSHTQAWLGDVSVPKTYNQALKSPQNNLWQKAMEEEMEMMLKYLKEGYGD